MIKHILVTGSEGYIGKTLVKDLLRKGYEVTGLDSGFYTHDNKKTNYRLIKQDIRELNKIKLHGYDAIIHLAALSNDPMGELNPALTERINYQATLGLAKKAKKEGVRRFLFSSSCSIYGIAKNGVVDEHSPVNPLTSYAKSKIKAEKELKKLADNHFTVGILRNSTVYGYSPSFRNDLVVNDLVTHAVSDKKIIVLSDGTPWRPLIDVRDLSTIFIAFLKAESNVINGKIINIGFNKSNYQIKSIIKIIQRFVPHCEVIIANIHGKDTRSYRVNFDTFHRLFPNIRQVWTLDRSVKDMVKNLKRIKIRKKDIDKKKFVRLATLDKLIDNKKLNKRLYWIK